MERGSRLFDAPSDLVAVDYVLREFATEIADSTNAELFREASPHGWWSVRAWEDGADTQGS
jgi:hypothetical protein